ncbi:hypothetical protein F5878DRAFT_660566 [Lentinula raphanica]|uniref:Uncharacterized protein n=1 Tax=Lentinula raphanica TaxID=153919 RepID=A0AA38UFB1_9AGAR|nr:hypothetical protein F5878DRAFT_660566 [Lentinula raphanica]
MSSSHSLNSRFLSTLSGVCPYFSSNLRLTRRTSTPASLLPIDVQIAAHNPSATVLNNLHREMKFFIHNGQLVTFSREIEDWCPWNSPIRALVSGAMTTVAPPSYEAIPGYKPPVCPHIMNPFLSLEDCEMKVKIYKAHGTTRYVFLAPHPGCQFRMNIPYYGHQKLDMEYDQDSGEDGDEIDLLRSAYLSLSQSSRSSLREVEESLMPGSQLSSASQSPSLASSSNSAFSFLPQGTSTPSRRPRPRPIEGQRKLESFYPAESAERRAAYDQDLVAELDLAYSQGIFRGKFSHFSSNLPLAILDPYNPSNNDGGITFNHLQYFDTSVGQIIRGVNTSLGARPSSFKYLVSLSRTCPVCLCEYSPDGFVAHNNNGEGSPRCMNTPGCPLVSDTRSPDVDPERLVQRTFLDGQHPAFNDQSDSALGRPWLEWNSKLGIPADVWKVIKFIEPPTVHAWTQVR